jgi:hypothetical protein
MPFDQLDGSLIQTFGLDATFTPYGSSDPEEVRVIRVDPIALSAVNALLVVFGTVADSGFSRAPAKNDLIEIDGVDYRMFDVQGPDLLGGYNMSLEKA